MDFHPLLVHFPIALFSIYALFEILSLTRFGKLAYAFYVKAVCVIAGALASAATYLSGSLIEDRYHGSELAHLVEVHSDYALATCLLFALISVCYLVVWVHRDLPNLPPQSSGFSRPWNLLVQYARTILQPGIVLPLAILGLLLVTIAGALGGSIVYGPNVDPVVSVVYRLIIR